MYSFESVDFLQGDNLRSMIGDDGVCALFSSWRCRSCRSWTSGAVLVVVVLLFQQMGHCSGTSLFCNSSLFFWLCISVWPLGQCVVAEVVCNWYLMILLNTPLKKCPCA